jgi:hypothetical protein
MSMAGDRPGRNTHCTGRGGVPGPPGAIKYHAKGFSTAVSAFNRLSNSAGYNCKLKAALFHKSAFQRPPLVVISRITNISAKILPVAH